MAIAVITETARLLQARNEATIISWRKGGGVVTVDEVRKGLTSPAIDCWLKFVSRIRHHLLLHGSNLGSQVLLKVIEQIQFIMFSRLWDPNTVPFLGIHLQVVRSP